MSEATKQRIIEAGVELVHRQGFNNTGLSEILKASGVPKGSFYFYFDNKEAFGIELVHHFMAQMGEIFGPILADESVPPLSRLDRWFERFIRFFEDQHCERGCLVGNLTQEMSDLSPAFRNVLNKAWNVMSRSVGRVLKQAVAAGELPSDMDLRQTADFIISTWQGAIMRMKVEKNIAPLRIAKDMIFHKILA